MLPDTLQPAPEPKRKPAPAPKAAPREAVEQVRQLVRHVPQQLGFAPPEFDPTAVSSARARLEEALAQPMTPARAQVEAAQRREAAGFSLGAGSVVSDSQREAGERAAAAGMGRGFGADLTADTAGTPGTPGIDRADAESALADALRNQRRHAIGVDNPDSDRRDQVKPLTAEQYEALDPRQRQAIDFNTMLVRAVHRDAKHADDYPSGGKERAEYDKTVNDLFGEFRGSDSYAPETVALLKQIGFSDKNADLDDFLSLKAAIHARDVKSLAGPEPTIKDALTVPERDEAHPVRQDRQDLAAMLAAKTGQLEKTLAQGQSLLQTITATANADRNDLVGRFGGVASNVKPDLGYGQTSRDQYYQLTFNTMARKDADVKKVLALVNQEHPEDYEDFLRYASGRLTNAERYGLELGGEDGVKYRSPEQFRADLGLEG